MPQKFRKTKVIATIGPACDDDATLRAMITAGMNVARLNMSHGDADSHAATLHRVRSAAQAVGATVAVMVDTRGCEIRTGALHERYGGKLLLERNQTFSLFGDGRAGDDDGVSTTHPALGEYLKTGDRVLIDDGQIELIVTESGGDKSRGDEIKCRVECGGFLRTSKGVNLPDNSDAYQRIAPDDSREIRFAAEHKVDYLAASIHPKCQ